MISLISVCACVWLTTSSCCVECIPPQPTYNLLQKHTLNTAKLKNRIIQNTQLDKQSYNSYHQGDLRYVLSFSVVARARSLLSCALSISPSLFFLYMYIVYPSFSYCLSVYVCVFYAWFTSFVQHVTPPFGTYKYRNSNAKNVIPAGGTHATEHTNTTWRLRRSSSSTVTTFNARAH